MILGKPLMPHSHPRTQRYDMRAPPRPSALERYRATLIGGVLMIIARFRTLLRDTVAHLTQRPD